MTILLLPAGEATLPASGDLFWIFVFFLVAAVFCAWAELAFIREQYRRSLRQWPHASAKFVWTTTGVGMEMLAGAGICIGIAGLLGLDSPIAMLLVRIALVCGAIGILMTVIAIVVNCIVSASATATTTGLTGTERAGTTASGHCRNSAQVVAAIIALVYDEYYPAPPLLAYLHDATRNHPPASCRGGAGVAHTSRLEAALCPRTWALRGDIGLVG